MGTPYIDQQQVHVLVTGEDPFADDIDAGSKDHFDDPASYDFSIVHFTDTQYLSEGAVEQETAEERAVWESAYGDTVDWLPPAANITPPEYMLRFLAGVREHHGGVREFLLANGVTEDDLLRLRAALTEPT